MSSPPVNLALVGCGDVAFHRHLPAIARHHSVNLVEVCDLDQSRIDEAVKAFGPVRGTTDYQQILDDSDVDGVIIATPPWVSPQLTIAALDAGKDVLCEKPMALTIEEARAVEATENRSDRFVQVGFVLRHGPLFATLKRWIHDNRLGSPLDVRVSIFDELWDPTHTPDHYQRILSTLEHGPPCIHDGAHTMDHLHFLLDAKAARLTSWGTTSRAEFPAPNYNVAIIEFEHCHRARVEIGWFLPVFPPGEWAIIGPNGFASFCQHESRVELHTSDGVETVSIEEDWIASCFRHQLDVFVHAVQTRKPPMPGCADGIASLSLCNHFAEGMNTPGTLTEVRYA